jgi:uncharacterized protein (TIGR04255 family)
MPLCVVNLGILICPCRGFAADQSSPITHTASMKIPVRLKHEPLVDAVFEIRFRSSQPAAMLIPGLLFQRKLEGLGQVQTTAFANIPPQLRLLNPQMQFSPTVQIDYGGRFVIGVGEGNVSVGCRLPYPGWGAFQAAIKNLLIALQGSFIESVSRYGLRYIDVISAATNEQQVRIFNVQFGIGDFRLERENFAFRVDVPSESFMNVVQLAANANVQLVTNEVRSGVVCDIETSESLPDENYDLFLERADDRLTRIHQTNKVMFFKCLRPETIAALEPVYEL